MSKLARAGVVSAIVVAVALVMAAAAGQSDALRRQARAALSPTTGSIAVSGLDGPVEVLRDRWGVPHIYATSEHDLFFAQGFVAAQDRLWQLDLWRRIAEGKLSEILGPSGVRRDTFARLLRYRGDWDAEWTSYGPRARAIVDAFVAGINAHIDRVTQKPATLPIEFQMIGSRPERWTPETVVSRMAGFVMTRNARSEVQRAQLVARVGAARAAQLMPTDPPVALAVPTGLDLADITDEVLAITTGTSESVNFAPLKPQGGAGESSLALWQAPGRTVDGPFSRDGQRGPSGRLVADEATPDPDVIGSNNWVVAGKHTATGKPILANDPHRSLMLPSLRYTVHLNGPGWNVIGAGEPALPGIAAGHNDRLAFGFTIVGIDQQDLYVERLDPANPDRYRYRGGWETLRVERETIHVKGEADRVVELRFTRHGPVLSMDAKRQRAYALRWVGAEPGSAGYLRSLMLDTASTTDDVRAAVAGWKVPSENIVYADVTGTIGWIAAGLSPIRRGWTGLLPVPGDTGEFEWDGFLKAAQLPQLQNPASGFITTANHNILPPKYEHQLGYEFGAPWRFNRLVMLLGGTRSGLPADGRSVHLDSTRRFTVGDFERMQHDERSLQASAIAGALAQATRAASEIVSAGSAPPRAGAASDNGARAAKLLSQWDGVLSKDSAAAALYETWMPLLGAAFGRAFISDEDRAATGERMSGDRIVAVLREAGFVLEPQQVPWVDGTPRGQAPRPAVSSVAPRARVIEVLTGTALGEAWRQMVARQGPDASKWTWGAMHQAAFEHPLAFDAERRAVLSLAPVPRGGDGTTVNATGGGARQTAGASYRQIIDLSNWDASVTVNVPGESGQPESEHYGDLLPLWAQGRYHPMLFSRAAVERETTARLRLVPVR